MTGTLEARARAVIGDLAQFDGDHRAAMAMRKHETLVLNRRKLAKQERKIMRLLTKTDYANLAPAIFPVAPKDKDAWLYARMVISSAPWNGRCGRFIPYWVLDTNTGGLLGIAELGSDMRHMGPRDKRIGWTLKRKYGGALNHVASLGTSVPVAPFGRLTGGKFISCAVLCDEVAAMWKARYGEDLAAISTTSLYGKSSQYNRLREYLFLGYTEGVGSFHLSKAGRRAIKAYYKDRAKEGEGKSLQGKQYGSSHDLLVWACEHFGMTLDDVSMRQRKGVYMADLAHNAVAFLKGDDAQLDRIHRQQDTIAQWWLDRWAAMRWPKVKDDVLAFDLGIYELDRMIWHAHEQSAKQPA